MKEKLRYLLCGLAMGAADVVPGVSGGTVAYITGIYDQLLNAIKAFDLRFFRLFFTGRWKEALPPVPWGFLLPLLFGIAFSIFTLAKLTLYLLHTWPQPLWGFFFGLILSSILLMTKGLRVSIPWLMLFLLSACTAWFITGAESMAASHTLLHIFTAGFIALCAMILPGISGSFILLILGQYAYILSALVNLQIEVLAVFLSGGLCGIMAFSRVLSSCLHRWPHQTNAVLIGFMAGSLRTVWPWHESSLPSLPSSLNGMVLLTATACLAGIALPLLIHAAASLKHSKS